MTRGRPHEELDEDEETEQESPIKRLKRNSSRKNAPRKSYGKPTATPTGRATGRATPAPSATAAVVSPARARTDELNAIVLRVREPRANQVPLDNIPWITDKVKALFVEVQVHALSLRANAL